MRMSENNTQRKTSNMDETPEDFEELDAAVLAESKKSPLEDCSHLPAARFEERHVLAWLESRMPVPVQGLRLRRRICDRRVCFILYPLPSTTNGRTMP